MNLSRIAYMFNSTIAISVMALYKALISQGNYPQLQKYKAELTESMKMFEKIAGPAKYSHIEYVIHE